MNVIVAVTGGIAAYKAADITNALISGGHSVRVVMTENAKKFITPLTLATLSKNPVYDDASEWGPDGMIKHIELGQWLDVLAVVPATANTLVKMANGIADNLLTSIFLAIPQEKGVIVAPAMNTRMWENLRVQQALNNLDCGNRPSSYIADRKGKVTIVRPVEGKLACGDVGVGKIAPTKIIVEAILEWIPNGIEEQKSPVDGCQH